MPSLSLSAPIKSKHYSGLYHHRLILPGFNLYIRGIQQHLLFLSGLPRYPNVMFRSLTTMDEMCSFSLSHIIVLDEYAVIEYTTLLLVDIWAICNLGYYK